MGTCNEEHRHENSTDMNYVKSTTRVRKRSHTDLECTDQGLNNVCRPAFNRTSNDKYSRLGIENSLVVPEEPRTLNAEMILQTVLILELIFSKGSLKFFHQETF